MSISIGDGVFILLSGLIILSALGVVLNRNIVHSAFFLVLSFLGIAGVFFDLEAGFLGLVQVLVYAGAISVLIIFAIMLVMNVEAGKTNPPNPSLGTRRWGGFLVSLLTAALGGSIWFSRLPPAKDKPVGDAVGALAGLMLGDYVVAFEVAAVLLLLAVVGTIILARGAEEE